MTLSTAAFAQSQSSLMKAIGKGDVEQVIKQLGEDVELCFFDEQDLYNKAEASTALRAFFKQHDFSGMTIKHAGDNQTGKSNYSIGELSSEQGRLRVFLYTAGKGKDLIIEELRFTKG